MAGSLVGPPLSTACVTTAEELAFCGRGRCSRAAAGGMMLGGGARVRRARLMAAARRSGPCSHLLSFCGCQAASWK